MELTSPIRFKPKPQKEEIEEMIEQIEKELSRQEENGKVIDYTSSETDNLWRPFARRAVNTRRPFAVDIRSRNPCLFFLLRTEGWNVLFISLFIKIRFRIELGLQRYVKIYFCQGLP